MGYVAVKGGQDAIENANELVEYYRLKGRTEPVKLDQVKTQFRLAIDRAMGEGSPSTRRNTPRSRSYRWKATRSKPHFIYVLIGQH